MDSQLDPIVHRVFAVIEAADADTMARLEGHPDVRSATWFRIDPLRIAVDQFELDRVKKALVQLELPPSYSIHLGSNA